MPDVAQAESPLDAPIKLVSVPRHPTLAKLIGALSAARRLACEARRLHEFPANPPYPALERASRDFFAKAVRLPAAVQNTAGAPVEWRRETKRLLREMIGCVHSAPLGPDGRALADPRLRAGKRPLLEVFDELIEQLDARRKEFIDRLDNALPNVYRMASDEIREWGMRANEALEHPPESADRKLAHSKLIKLPLSSLYQLKADNPNDGDIAKIHERISKAAEDMLNYVRTAPQSRYRKDEHGQLVPVAGAPAGPRPPQERRLLEEFWALLIRLDQAAAAHDGKAEPPAMTVAQPAATPAIAGLAAQPLKPASTAPTAVQDTAAAEAVEASDKPDERGYVQSPTDPAAYAPVSDILAKHTPADLPISMNRLVAIIEDYDANRVRWTRPLTKNGRPMQNRRSVHLGDWAAYMKRRMPAEADGFPRLTEGEIEDIERRKDAARRLKRAEK